MKRTWKTMLKNVLTFTALIFSLVLLTACEIRINNDDGDRERGEDLESFNRKISLSEDVRTMRTELHMGGGVLKVSGTDSYAMEGKFRVDDRDNLKIDYSEEDQNSRLKITHEDDDVTFEIGDDRNLHDEWEIFLNREVEQDLDILLGAGESTLDLSDFNLNEVIIQMGAGENRINLKNSSPRRLNVEAGVGDIRIDLSGDWDNDCRINVSGGVGHLVMIVPKDMDIDVEVNGGLGSVEAPGMEKDGRRYYQRGRGHKLDIEVNAGIGSLEIISE